MFNNQFTYVGGGFFLDYQDVPPQGSCAAEPLHRQHRRTSDYARNGPNCLVEHPVAAATARRASRSRSLLGTYQTVRQSWEAKTDGTYFLTNTLGGDHSLKFGVGWRRNPILTFSHYSGGARATFSAWATTRANCGDGNYVAGGHAAPGFVPRTAVALSRPAAEQRLVDLQRLHPGRLQPRPAAPQRRPPLRLADVEVPRRLRAGQPAAAGSAAGAVRSGTDQSTVLDVNTGLPILDAERQPVKEKLPSFSNWAPRVSATYDLFGNGKTSVHASYSLYYETKITLANSLGGLFTQPALTWGPNQGSGACSTAAGAPCWTRRQSRQHRPGQRAHRHADDQQRAVQSDHGHPHAGRQHRRSRTRKLARTREVIAGVQHELIPNLAVGVDYIYRKYDHGTATYTAGYQPGASQFPLSQIYAGPYLHRPGDADPGAVLPDLPGLHRGRRAHAHRSRSRA